MSFLGANIAQWINAFGVITMIGFILRFELGRRKLAFGDTADIRAHYAKEVAALRERLIEIEAHYRQMLSESDKAHEECKRDRDALHEEIGLLRKEIDGLRRQITLASADRLVILEGNGDAPEGRASATRVKNIIEER